MVTAFWVGMLIGRAFIGNVAKKYGLIRTLVTQSIIAAIIMTVATQVVQGEVMVPLFFGLLGLSMSGIYAFIFTMATGRFPGHSNDIVSAMVLCTSLGVIVLPTLFALVGHAWGMRLLPLAFIPLLLVLIPIMNQHRRAEKLATESASVE